MIRPPPRSTPFPYTTLSRSGFGLMGPAASLDRAQQLAMIDLNVRVLTELSLRFAPSLVRHQGGILNVASIASFMPGPGMKLAIDRKSTRLNSSHTVISYAVF